jgi:hypothetical protein
MRQKKTRSLIVKPLLALLAERNRETSGRKIIALAEAPKHEPRRGQGGDQPVVGAPDQSAPGAWLGSERTVNGNADPRAAREEIVGPVDADQTSARQMWPGHDTRRQVTGDVCGVAEAAGRGSDRLAAGVIAERPAVGRCTFRGRRDKAYRPSWDPSSEAARDSSRRRDYTFLIQVSHQPSRIFMRGGFYLARAKWMVLCNGRRRFTSPFCSPFHRKATGSPACRLAPYRHPL